MEEMLDAPPPAPAPVLKAPAALVTQWLAQGWLAETQASGFPPNPSSSSTGRTQSSATRQKKLQVRFEFYISKRMHFGFNVVVLHVLFFNFFPPVVAVFQT